MIVAGTRPEVIKLAPIIRELEEFVFVWSGQHRDYEMGLAFLEELGIPKPSYVISASNTSHAKQTSDIMLGVERIIRSLKPGLVAALGDTNTVLAAALSSVKLRTPFIHIEAGLRSRDPYMPEEINRVIADRVSYLNLSPSLLATINLLHEGIPLHKVKLTGNPIIDMVLQNIEEARKIAGSLDLPDIFILATIHREENVENHERLRNIVEAMIELSSDIPIILPLHPRTRRKLEETGLIRKIKEARNIKVMKPLRYKLFLGLIEKAALILTDSGGVQEEAFTLGTPVITLRDTTERPETILLGGNMLAGARKETIIKLSKQALENIPEIKNRVKRAENPYGRGNSGKIIAKIIMELSESLDGLGDNLGKQLLYYRLKDPESINDEDIVLCHYDSEGYPTIEAGQAAHSLVLTSDTPRKVLEEG